MVWYGEISFKVLDLREDDYAVVAMSMTTGKQQVAMLCEAAEGQHQLQTHLLLTYLLKKKLLQHRFRSKEEELSQSSRATTAHQALFVMQSGALECIYDENNGSA